jgi:signal peptidase II
LASSGPVSLLNDAVRFELIENLGAILGFGSNLPREVRFLLFVVFTGAIGLIALAFTVSARRPIWWQWVGLSLVAGGGVANLVDRILNDGAVTDFVRLKLGPLRTGVFNLADVAIVVGAALVLLASTRVEHDSPEASVQ